MKLYALAGCDLSAEEHIPEEINQLIEPYLEQIYAGERDDDRIIEDIYFRTASELLQGYEEGYEKEFFKPDWTVKDNNLLTRVQNNIFAFSGAKTYAEMQELRDAVYENGKLLSPGDFRRRARQINARYNIRYLEVERKQVVASGTQGSRWLDIEETADTYPYLEYVTARDERVRESHRSLDGLIYPVGDDFWKSYYPPNGWGPCRCSARKRTEREYSHLKKQYESRAKIAMPDSETGQKIAGKVVAKPFRQNVGTSEIFERDGHPYFRANKEAKAMQLSAVKHYGMKPVKDIYLDERKLSKYKSQDTDFNEFWDKLEEKYGKPGEGFTLVDKRNQISAKFDPELKDKIVKRKRTGYFSEVTDVFFRPDEVWATFQPSKNRRFGEEYFNVYIRYYEDKPIVLLVDRDGVVNSFYRWDKSLEDFEKFRIGLLKKK